MFAASETKPHLMPSIDTIRDGLHISYSQISTYLMCPLKFQFQYVLGLQPEFIPVALPFGGAFHEVLALLFKTIQVTGEAPSLRDLQESFADHWHTQEEHGKGYIRLKNDETWADMKDLGVKLIETYFAWLKDRGMPSAENVVAVEQPLRVSLGSIDFIGIVDLILRDVHEPSTFHLIDHKTAARRYDEAKIASDMQMTAYKFLIEEGCFLPDDASLTLNWDVVLKTKKPAVERYTTVRCETDVQRFKRTTQAILTALDQEVFYPNSGWMCPECGHQRACAGW